MKYYFILNPVSGGKKHKNEILYEIRDAVKKYGIDYDVYYTKGPGDAQRYVRELCKTHRWEAELRGEDPDSLRVIGVGGDGTVNELVNGAFGFDNVEVGAIPYGTGNDYIRNYGDPDAFRSVEGQILGESRDSDLIRYRAEYQGAVTEGLCANMFNIGFDADVVDMTENVKTWPLMNGSTAYLAAILFSLGRKREISLRVEYGPGRKIYDGNVLLISVANGCFCGGGIKGVPRAVLDDGLMDVSRVKSGVTRRFFVRMFSKYQKGTHLEDPRVARVFDYEQTKTLAITSNGEYLKLCVDGEITRQKRVEFEVVPCAVRFIVPPGV